MERLGSYGMDLHEISYLKIFKKYAQKIQVSLKSDKNNWHFIWRNMYIYDNIVLNSS